MLELSQSVSYSITTAIVDRKYSLPTLDQSDYRNITYCVCAWGQGQRGREREIERERERKGKRVGRVKYQSR